MKVMFLGDVHSNMGWVKHVVIPEAVRNDVRLILQLGDWGFLWPGHDQEEELNTLLSQVDIPMWFIDGNHDDHEKLRYELRKVDTPYWDVGSHLRYMPRGYRFEVDGVSFLALGGAYSIDKMYRKEGVSWWREEEIALSEANRAVESGKVTVMLTHDLPWGVELAWDRKAQFPEANPNRKMVRWVVDETRPKWLFHGHMHYRQTTLLPLTGGHMVRVESLNCDDPHDDHGRRMAPENNWVIRDTASLSSITRDLDMSKVVRAG